MRRVIAEQARGWLTQAAQSWMSFRGRVAPHLDAIESGERSRLAALGLGVSVVAGSVLLGGMLRSSIDQPQFWLLHLAIVLSAAYGGTAAALVATLLSVLVARIALAGSLSTALLFGAEGLLIAFVIVRMARVIQESRQSLTTLNSSIRELGSVKRQASRMDAALSRLEHASEDTAVILLDRTGHISDWRTSATRVYGFDSCEMVGRGAATTFDELGEADFFRLLTDARLDSIRHTGRQVRAAGTFAAEIEISPVISDGFDGFSMVVHDLTRQQARAAADWSAAETHAQLGAEVAQAQRRLSTLQHLTDPALNAFGDLEFVTELLDRLRLALNAEGIALIHFGRVPHHVFCASNGLQCQRGNHRPLVAGKADTARTLVVHNDPSGVAALSAAKWPDDVSSLIAVPLVRSGAKQAVMEVVNRTGRRSTEWEIALVQIVAGRIAWSLEDEIYRDSGARAWIADSRSVPHTEPEGSLRLWLGEHLSDQG
jgi:PAS domain S-box-containing protein